VKYTLVIPVREEVLGKRARFPNIQYRSSDLKEMIVFCWLQFMIVGLLGNKGGM
jgi:hypothetical protein